MNMQILTLSTDLRGLRSKQSVFVQYRTQRDRVRLLVCYHCLGAAYTVAVYLHTPLCHFLCLSTRASVLRLLSCHSAALKPFLLAGTNYKSINSLSQSLHEVSTDSALCNPDWQLIFKGCTSLIVVSPGLRYLVNPVALLWQFEKKKDVFISLFLYLY